MASTMYRYYQPTGGDEPWTPIQAHISLDMVRPTFATVLAVDTLIDATTPKDVIAKAKYQGPMYFDLDAEDVQHSINGAKLLVAKLKEHELQDSDMRIYLSGKKGLHILVPEQCFMTKVVPVQGLVAIYKEIAFQLAVDTMDFRVYTAKRGRQFRTCYNVRENGNYKVPITLSELETLTPELYQTLCKQPRVVTEGTPQWRARFALLYDQAAQKISRIKPKVSKPVSKDALAQQLPVFDKLAAGLAETDTGFNNIAMQLCLYARESGWTEDFLIQKCEGIIKNHKSDGVRYNTPWRREAELRRMFWYLEDNPSFEYSVQGIRACMNEPAHTTDEGEVAHDVLENFGGVYRGVSSYMAIKGEDGDVPVTNFVFRDVEIFRSVETGMINKIIAKMVVQRQPEQSVALTPQTFTGGSGLQNFVSTCGGAFSGTDIHARGVYQAMLKEVSKDNYVMTTEGINLVRIGTGSTPKQDFVVWADREGVKSAVDFSELGFSLIYEGDPDPRGMYKTDLLAAPTLDKMLADDGPTRLVNMLDACIKSHTPESMGKMLGWTIAAFYAPFFHALHRKFPLLHVYGPAGSGKTELTSSMLQMFYHREEPLKTTPNSSVFALQQMLAGSASIPLLLDEYKPSRLASDKVNALHALLRDVYNAKEIQRGGGNRVVKDNYNALSTLKMTAPLVFVAEAPETETAIVERSLMVSFKRLSGRQQSDAYRSALVFYSDMEPLTSIGLEIAGKVVATNDVKASMRVFDEALAWANNKFLPSPDDYNKVLAGEMSEEDMRVRATMRPRNVYNATVAFFGLQMLKGVLVDKLGKATYDSHFRDPFIEMAKAVYHGMETISLATLPEYIKVLSVMADMSKLPASEPNALMEGVDYTITEYADKPVIVLAPMQCYRKYRSYLRSQGISALYPSEDAFKIALHDIPQFIRVSAGTAHLETATVVLDLEELYKASVPIWRGKAVSLRF